jgi:hypothetical protein
MRMLSWILTALVFTSIVTCHVMKNVFEMVMETHNDKGKNLLAQLVSLYVFSFSIIIDIDFTDFL